MQDAAGPGKPQPRPERATKAGYFKEQILPVMLKSKQGRHRAFDTDEHFRPNCSLEDMSKLKPAFLKENGTVTAGNASGINDAAAAVVLMDSRHCHGTWPAKPLARLVGYAHMPACRPQVSWAIGPQFSASQKPCSKRLGLARSRIWM
jgi:acetyl-CoA C-acetyltransferase